MASQSGCMRFQRSVDKQCARQTSFENFDLQPKQLTRTFRLKRHAISRRTPSVSCTLIRSSKDVRNPVENSILSSHASFNTTCRSNKPFANSPSRHRKSDAKTLCSADVYTLGDSITGSSQHVSEEKIGVLLLNLGGPDTLHDVEPFLFNLFADPDIIRLPRLFRFLQKPLAKLISVSRAPKSKEGYASIGGGSPLRKMTSEQANALKMVLGARNISANVYIGMRYWYPFTEEAVHQIRRDKITKLVVLPLYPQYSISTSGSSIRLLQSIFRRDPHLSRLPVSIIDVWYNRRGYVEAMATLIQRELSNFSSPEEVTVFFSAHGVPLSYVRDAGDPYKDQMEDCIDLIMKELKSRGIENPHVLAYQSRVGPVQWLKPYTDEVIVELGEKGVESLLAVPVSFVSEHIETLEEMDVEYRELALSSGIKNWARVPTLGCDSAFIADLAEAVIEALPTASMVVANNPGTEHAVDPVQRAVNMLFGSVFAFFLLLAPKFLLALKNSVP